MGWTNRLMNLLHGGRLNAEIDEEIAFHAESLVRDNLARGMTLEEARQDAARRFGSRMQVREETRDADVFLWIDSFSRDLHYALRSLWKNPGAISIAVLSLALAIGSGTAIFSVVDAVLLRGFPYKDSARIVIVWTTNALNNAVEQNTSLLNLQDWKARSHSFEDLAAYRESDGPLVEASSQVTEAEWVDFAFVTGNFFSLLGRSTVLGGVFGEEELISGAKVAVLSSRFWRRCFNGAQDILGKVVAIGGQDFQVIGVMPDDFRFPRGDMQLWVPFSAHPEWRQFHTDRRRRLGTVFGRLRPGIALEAARTEMHGMAAQLGREYPAANENLGANIVPLDVQVNGKSVPFMLAMLFGAVMFVLLIACANVTSLLLARGVAREREIAVRAALGAGRWRIARQLLTESVLLSCVAGCAALPLTAWGVHALVVFAPRNIARIEEVHLDGAVLLFTFCLSLTCGVLFGIAPATRLSKKQPLHSNSRNAVRGPSAGGLQGVFVAGQFAMAVALLAGAGLLVRSLLAVQSIDSGIGEHNLITATLRFQNAIPPAQRAALYRKAIDRISGLPGVRAAGAISSMFRNSDWQKFGLRAVEGQLPEPRERWTPLTWVSVGGDYFQALGIPLRQGRFFSDRDREDSPPAVLINQTMARRYWSGKDAIGKRIKGFDPRGRNDEWVTVVGVVQDFHNRGLERTPMAEIYESQSQSLDATANLVVSAVRPAGMEESIRTAVRSLGGLAVLSDFSTVELRLSAQAAERRFETWLLGVFAAIALAIAGAGIFGAMHYSVAQRTQEIGIRVALGAQQGDVLRMVLREGLRLAAVGLTVGIAGSLALTRTMSSLLYGVRPEDPATFAAVALALTWIAIAGCAIPARRATRVDPVVALRCD